SIKQILSGAVEFIWNFIQVSFIGRIFKAVQTFAKNFIKVIRDKWETVKNAFSTAINFVKDVVSKGFNAVKNIVNSVLNTVKGIVDKVWNGISNTIST